MAKSGITLLPTLILDIPHKTIATVPGRQGQAQVNKTALQEWIRSYTRKKNNGGIAISELHRCMKPRGGWNKTVPVHGAASPETLIRDLTIIPFKTLGLPNPTFFAWKNISFGKKKIQDLRSKCSNLAGIINILALNVSSNKTVKTFATLSAPCCIWTLAQSHFFCNWQDKKKARKAVHVYIFHMYSSIFPVVKRRQCSLVRPGPTGWSGHVRNKWTRLNWLSADWTFE